MEQIWQQLMPQKESLLAQYFYLHRSYKS
jgi:hypothetical protein